MGHLYQGRFKSFPVQHDAHYLTAMRYIEANPLRAKLVKHAGDWPWSSLALRKGLEAPIELSHGPVKLPANWEKLLNRLDKPQRMANLATTSRMSSTSAYTRLLFS